jgi:hypothetical protein
MGSRLLEIERRKHALIGECEDERALFAEAWRGLERPVALGNRAVQTLRSPLLWAGVGLVALKLPKSRLLRMPMLLWKGWRLAHRVRMAFG